MEYDFKTAAGSCSCKMTPSVRAPLQGLGLLKTCRCRDGKSVVHSSHCYNIKTIISHTNNATTNKGSLGLACIASRRVYESSALVIELFFWQPAFLVYGNHPFFFETYNISEKQFRLTSLTPPTGWLSW